MTLPFVRFAAFLTLVAALTGLSAVAQTGGTGTDSPLVHRINVSGDKLAIALKKVDEGSLVRMTPADLDRLLIAARSDSFTQGLTATLTEARYRAKYTEGPDGAGLFHGTGEWSVRRPAGAPPGLPLEGMQLAVRQAKWSDGQDAVLYKLPGDLHPYIRLPDGASRTLNLEWTARGVPEPGETQFELRVPAVPLASMELELPSGLVPVLPQEEALLTGPFPSGPAETVWRVAFGGLSRLEIVLRRATEKPDVLFTRVVATQSLTGAEGTARYEFQVESPKVGFTELTFGHDGGFAPSAVRVNNLVQWTANTGGSQPPNIVVRLREPTRSAVVVFTGALTVLPGTKPWVSPGVWLQAGFLRSERLKIVLSPSCRFRDWTPNSFQLARSDLGIDQSYSLEADRIVLDPSKPHGGRPSIQISARPSAGWTATQQIGWHIGRDGETVTAKTTIQADGAFPRLVRFPLADWQVSGVSVGTAEAIWTVTNRGTRKLEVEIAPADRNPEITIALRRPARPPLEEIPFPDLLPESAGGRTGTLTASADAGMELVPSEHFPEASPRSAPANELVRTLTAEPLPGWVIVRPRPARSRVEIRSDIQPGRATGAIRSILTVAPEVGSVAAFNLWTSSPVKEPWEWRDEQGRYAATAVRDHEADARRWLLALAPAMPHVSATTLAGVATNAGTRWRLNLSRPADRTTTLYSDYDRRDPHISSAWPVPWAVGCQFQGTVSLPSDVPRQELDARWISASSRAETEKAFQYGSATDRVPVVRHSPIRPEVERLRLVTAINADGERRCTFQMGVRRWKSGELPLHLPAGADDMRAFVAGRIVPVESTSEGTARVPVPASDSWTEVRIEYRLPPLTEPLFTRVPVELPSGSFDADAIQQVWYLSPEWGLAESEGFHILAGGMSNTPPLPLPNWKKIDHLLGFDRLPTASVNAVPGQTAATTLGRAFPNQPVILDVHSTGRAGLFPNTPADGDPLKIRGLVAVQLPSCVLISEPGEINRWHLQGNWREPVPADVANALDEAMRAGSDASGRFQTLANWASHHDYAEPVIAPAGWIVVEGDGTRSDGPGIYRRDRVEALCWISAIVFALAVLGVVRNMRRRLAIFTAVCGVAVLIVLRGPSMGSEIAVPILVVFAFASRAATYLDRRTAPAAQVARDRPSTAAVTTALVLFVAVVQAAPTPPTDVFQVLDADGKVTEVLVPRELVERFHSRGRRTPDAVITAASYQGAADGGTARFHVRYQVFSLREQPTEMRIPLAGVRVRSVSLDGAEARDIDAAADGLQVTLKGKGAHTLEVDFAVPIASAGTEQEVKLMTPEVPVSKLKFEIAGPASRLRTGAWRGAVRTTSTAKTTTLEADLGAGSTISLRWNGGDDRNPAVRATDVWVWQIGHMSATLVGAVDYRVTGGPISELRLTIPPRAEVCRVTAIGESGAVGSQGTRVKDWQVSPPDATGQRQLRVELFQPVTGRIAFQFELAATMPSTGRLSLQFPRCLGAAEANSLAAVEFQGLNAPAEVEAGGWTEIPLAALQESIKANFSDTAFAGKVSLAFRASRAVPGAVIVAPSRTTSTSTVTEAANWYVAPARISGMVESRYTGTALSLVEWTVPASLTVSEVTTKNLVAWSQTGERVQVWLDRPVAEAIILWRASRPRTPEEGAAVPIPAIHHVSAASAKLDRRARALNGWVLTKGRAGVPKETLVAQAPGELAWACSTDVPLELTLLPPEPGLTIGLRTVIGMRGDRMHSTHSIDLRPLDASRPHVFSVVLSVNRDDEVELSAPPPFLTRDDGSRRSVTRRWDIGIPAGPRADNAINIECTSVAGRSGPWRVPQVEVRFGTEKEPPISETLTVDAEAVALTDTVGLERAGAGQWRAARRPWQATVVRSAGLGHGESIRVSSARIAAGRVGRRWQYHCDCMVACTGPTVLSVAAPDGSTLGSASVDGESLGVPDEGELRVLLPANAGTHSLRLKWLATDLVARPAVLRALGEAVPMGDVDFVAYVPAEYRIEASDAEVGGPSTRTSTDDRLRGFPHRYGLKDNQQLDLRLLPDRPVVAGWQIALLIGLWLAALLFAFIGTPESPAFLAGFVTAAVGPAAGALLLIPLGIFTWRMRRTIGVVARRFARREAGAETS